MAGAKSCGVGSKTGKGYGGKSKGYEKPKGK
jgi:hypothetical protein